MKNIQLKVPKGKFVCIIGKTGAGKSSLLSALCGEMLTLPQNLIEHYKGKEDDMDRVLEPEEATALMEDLIHNASTKHEYEVNGSIAYTAQSPWIRNRKIRTNIIYDQPFDPQRYADTIQACEFERDVKL